MTKYHNPELDEHIGIIKPVLGEHGFIRLIDYMGGDESIVQAARVSYGAGTKTVNEDRGLIRYLMRHRHTTPFEMCEIKLHVKLPIFVARQWIRHRTASVNEVSARYSILSNEFYIPRAADIQKQSATNNQGRGADIDEAISMAMIETIRQQAEGAYQLYEELHHGWPWFDENGTPWSQYGSREIAEERFAAHENGFGMARELARMVLPTNIYTEWYWKVDLHNLLHFLSLRADPHAQKEIRVYAEAICDIVRVWCPAAFEAFEDYVLGAETFSRMEMEQLADLVAGTFPSDLKPALQKSGMSDREQREFLKKIGLDYE